VGATGATGPAPTGSQGAVVYLSASAVAAATAVGTASQFLKGGTTPAWSALASGDIPNNAANTSGTAGGLSGTPAITVGAVTSSGGTIKTSYAQGTNLPEAGQAYFFNPTNAINQDASCAVRLAGSTARYAYVSYDINGVAGYSHGILGSSQNLVFRASWDMSSATIFTMDRTGNFTAALDITAYSDKRIKTDIKRIEGALDKVSQIGGYTFMRTDEVSKGQRQAGVLAQELLEVLPEVVRVNEETGYYTVSYGNITALLIEALKEERQKRESLEEFLRSLEERVKFLEQK
jgi:hypothetical protein